MDIAGKPICTQVQWDCGNAIVSEKYLYNYKMIDR